MKTKKTALISFMVLLFVAATPSAELKAAETRPYMGVWLDTSPLPDLLIKHLGLSPSQGIRITNVHRDSPADRAGLERDDIIIAFEGNKVLSSESQKFIDKVRKAGIDTEVALEIIHLGERKTLKLRLEPFDGERDFKYPPEPEFVQSWRPGKMFRLKPGDKDWIEIELPFVGKSLEVYDYHHLGNGAEYTITIEGDPNDEDTNITLRIGDEEYKSTVDRIDKLPEKYRDAAAEALKNSRKYSMQRRQARTRKFSVPPVPRPDELLKSLKDSYRFPVAPEVPPFPPDEGMLDKIEKQMRKLQERIEELEKRLGEAPERSSDKPDKQELQEQEKPARPVNKERQRV
jgi:hypothetical protein